MLQNKHTSKNTSDINNKSYKTDETTKIEMNKTI